MQPRALPLLLCSALSLGPAWAADGGPGAHARGPFDAASGVYTVVGGDTLGSIAARFGTAMAQVQQQNGLTSTQVRVGQRLVVGTPAPSAPAADAAPAEVSSVVATPPPIAPSAAPAPATLTATAPPQVVAPLPRPADPWPRKVQVDDRTLLVYQPQIVSWGGNELVLRAAVAVLPLGQGDEAFGVIEAQAQTQVDRVQRLLVLQGLKVTKADFPTVPALAASLAPAVARQFGAQVRVIPLSRFEAALAATPIRPAAGVAVENPVPRIILSFEPAILIPIQGQPVLKGVPNTKFQRVINTRAVILTEGADGPYYLHLLDGWVSAQSLAGPWTHAPITPAGMDDIASRLAAAGQADLLNGHPSIPTMQLLAAGIPDIYVTETPAELIVFKGQPKLVPIAGTGLEWATNSSAQVIVDTSDNSYYALLAGRWYRAAGLQGPWSFVASTALPTGFKQIPVNSPAGAALAAVAGTPQAREALIANAIPQTAAVRRRGGPTFEPVFDGPATVSLLPGTDLEYVVNSETPIVRVGGATYYALQAGVWFESATLDGPWAVADSVPSAVYGIPPSSPLHFITYARVYGSTPEVVYDGYTPGYLGTVATTDDVVVYGTGYDYQPWVGDDWYAAPETFGLAAEPFYNPRLGYGYGFGQGLATAAAADAYWGGADYRPGVAGLGCCLGTGTNVYGHWGDTVAAGTRTWYDGADGALGAGARGDSVDLGTGTTGGYAAGRSVDLATGTVQGGYGRTFDRADGATGAVAAGARYNPVTGIQSAAARETVTGPGGDSIARDTATIQGPSGATVTVHQTSFDNERTGADASVDTVRVGDSLYAGPDGTVYRHTDDGWQQRGTEGWQEPTMDTGWADREQQARTRGEDSVGDDGFGGGGGLGAARVGTEGLGDGFGGDRLGGGDPFSGGVGARFGGGGFGGRFGGRR
ncbi:LysM peptidoglycan-binding domain-containing protein [Candidatus Thiodictyon syntrophicum]|nr:LysM peptidoglycan-binding domain-containing protein [Candidatus Thiodictyon syntrophicum]